MPRPAISISITVLLLAALAVEGGFLAIHRQRTHIAVLEQRLAELRSPAPPVRPKPPAHGLPLFVSRSDRSPLVDPAIDSAVRSLFERISAIKGWFANHPEKQLPELASLRDQDWSHVAAKLQQPATEEALRRAASSARQIALSHAASSLGKALGRYADANGGVFPASVWQLAPYLGSNDKAVDLGDWEMYQPNASAAAAPMPLGMSPRAVVDPDYDHFLIRAGIKGTMTKMLPASQPAPVAIAKAKLPQN